MKRVCLYAYDKVNLGDDLFIRTIAARYTDTKFYLWSDGVNKQNFSDVVVYAKFLIFRIN